VKSVTPLGVFFALWIYYVWFGNPSMIKEVAGHGMWYQIGFHILGWLSILVIINLHARDKS